MKRLLAVFFIFVLIFSMVGCKKTKPKDVREEIWNKGLEYTTVLNNDINELTKIKFEDKDGIYLVEEPFPKTNDGKELMEYYADAKNKYEGELSENEEKILENMFSLQGEIGLLELEINSYQLNLIKNMINRNNYGEYDEELTQEMEKLLLAISNSVGEIKKCSNELSNYYDISFDKSIKQIESNSVSKFEKNLEAIKR